MTLSRGTQVALVMGVILALCVAVGLINDDWQLLVWAGIGAGVGAVIALYRWSSRREG